MSHTEAPSRPRGVAGGPIGRIAVAAAVAGTLLPLAASGARADEETTFDTVSGYTILRSDDPKEAHPCRMFREYTPAQDNTLHAISISRGDGTLIISLVFDKWNWEKGKTYQARFSIDKQLIDGKAQWYGAGKAMAAKFADVIVPKLSIGKRMIVGFSDGERDFDLVGFRAAYDAVGRCDRAPPAAPPAPVAAAPAKPVPPAPAKPGPAAEPAQAPPSNPGLPPSSDPKVARVPPAPAPIAQAPVAPAPVVQAPPAAPPGKAPVPGKAPEPSAPPAAPKEAAVQPTQDRAAAYLYGLYLRWAIDACDMSTTRRQREALDAKQLTLKPQFAAVEPLLREALKTLQAKGCPPAADLERALQVLADNGADDFIGKVDAGLRDDLRGLLRNVPGLAAATAAAPVAAGPAPVPGSVTDVLTGMKGGPAPAAPAAARIATYLYGLAVQDAIQRCDVRSTSKQRAALDAKLQGLKGEMAPVEGEVRRKLKERGDACPPADEIALMEKALPILVEKSPEEFSDAMDRMTAAPKP